MIIKGRVLYTIQVSHLTSLTNMCFSWKSEANFATFTSLYPSTGSSIQPSELSDELLEIVRRFNLALEALKSKGWSISELVDGCVTDDSPSFISTFSCVFVLFAYLWSPVNCLPFFDFL
jgi:hypothetical protein